MTEELEELLKIFGKGAVLTARKIAEETGCTKATAERRVQALMAQGFILKRVKVREGSRGFPSTGWVMR